MGQKLEKARRGLLKCNRCAGPRCRLISASYLKYVYLETGIITSYDEKCVCVVSCFAGFY